MATAVAAVSSNELLSTHGDVVRRVTSSDIPVVVPATGKPVEYTYGVSGVAHDAWPTIGPHVKKVKLGTRDNEYQYFEFPTALDLDTDDPGPYCLPEELLRFRPTNDQIFKYFFKGTPREVAIRQIFFHTELTDQEQEWLRQLRDYCRWKNFVIRPCLEPFLLRLCYYNWRKYGPKGYLQKTYDHLLETTNWRASMFPLCDLDPDISADLKRGVMYWTARDAFFRPLLIVRLKRLPSNTSPLRFKRLTIFCFEWALRYLFETCTVLFDVRGIAIHSFPLSALSDMTNTLTRQYPFRLDRMFIINDSIFIQTVWSIAKQFLTEVQQQKMNFMRTGYAAELLKSYAAHHLEKEFGGTRPEITSFYPFPLLPGPFQPGERGPNTASPPHCHKTVKGKVWEGLERSPICWSPAAFDVFTSYNIPLPHGVQQQQQDTHHSPDRTRCGTSEGLFEGQTTTTTTTSAPREQSDRRHDDAEGAIQTPETASPVPEVVQSEDPVDGWVLSPNMTKEDDVSKDGYVCVVGQACGSTPVETCRKAEDPDETAQPSPMSSLDDAKGEIQSTTQKTSSNILSPCTQSATGPPQHELFTVPPPSPSIDKPPLQRQPTEASPSIVDHDDRLKTATSTHSREKDVARHGSVNRSRLTPQRIPWWKRCRCSCQDAVATSQQTRSNDTLTS